MKSLKFLFPVLMLTLLSFTPSAEAQEGFLGEVRLFAGTFAPRGWAYCDGQMLAISENTALFSILGTTYGGDGRTTFALPKLRGPKHQLAADRQKPNSDAVSSGLGGRAGRATGPDLKYIICLQGIFPSRN